MDAKFELSMDAKEEFDKYLLEQFSPDKKEELVEFFIRSLVKVN